MHFKFSSKSYKKKGQHKYVVRINNTMTLYWLSSCYDFFYLKNFIFIFFFCFDKIIRKSFFFFFSGDSQTNITLLYTDSSKETDTKALASFLVPEFTKDWAKFALEIQEDNVVLYFRCIRFATRQVSGFLFVPGQNIY